MRAASAPVHVPARAALAGNPSDAYGGAVLAICVEALRVTVRARDGAVGRDEGELVRAARARFAAAGLARRTREPALEVTTTIPREVGLAGSSAIVVGVLRALCAWHGSRLEDVALAELALAAEVEELGIAAGPQDRVAQASGGLVLMDFARRPWRVRRLDRRGAGGLYVAWRTAAAAPSGRWHAALARRPRDEVAATMDALGDAARGAAAAVASGDRRALSQLIDASLTLRAELGPLDADQLALATTARAQGLSANFAGSGGAIVGTYDNMSQLEKLQDNSHDLKCIVMPPDGA